jgi:hypothetical protein
MMWLLSLINGTNACGSFPYCGSFLIVSFLVVTLSFINGTNARAFSHVL